MQRTSVNNDDPFGLQKRRLVDSFEGLTLSSVQSNGHNKNHDQIKLSNVKDHMRDLKANRFSMGRKLDDQGDDKKVLI